MFPPAQLPLDEALRQAARAPLLGRNLVAADLVVPLAKLPEADRAAARHAGFGMTRCTLCVVGVAMEEGPAAAQAIRAHRKANLPLVEVAALEVHGTAFPEAQVAALRDAIAPVRLFLEPRWPISEWPRRERDLFAMLRRTGVGLKVRGAGDNAVDNVTLANLLPRIAAAGVPFKATQGLHHPLVDPARGNRLGFLSLAFAVRLAHLRRADAGILRRVLEETNPHAYAFGGGVSWRGARLGENEVLESRAALPFTIGSCSLDEPAADLDLMFPPAR